MTTTHDSSRSMVAKRIAFGAGIGALMTVAALGIGIGVLRAQEAAEAQSGQDVQSGGSPPGVQQSPTEAEIAAFEQEQGAPMEAFNDAPVELPPYEEPGSVPPEVRALVPEKDLIDLNCAMTRWKSGSFFAAMDAIKTYMVPAAQKALNAGIDLPVPDTAGMKAEGNSRIAAICAAKTLDDAQQLTKDFARWGRDQGAEQMSGQRTVMSEKMKAQGDLIKVKVNEQLQPFIDQETAKISPDIEARAQSIVNSILAPWKSAGLTGAPSGTPPTEAEITAQVEAQLQPYIAQKKTEIETKIKAKAQTIVAPETKRLQAIGAIFEGIGQKIDAYIKSHEGAYGNKYKSQALKLRKNVIIALLDKNVAEATKAIDANAAQLDAAKKADPKAKSAADLKAELKTDRNAVVTKMTAAVNADDEFALSQALDDFRNKWDGIQAAGEKSAAEAVGKICTAATPQFAAAVKKIEPTMAKIQSILNQCQGQSTTDCLKVNEFADRLDTVNTKLGDLKLEMGFASQLCAEPTPDTAALFPLLEKLQADGEDARIYGEALMAEKRQALADTGKSACDQALPQLAAAQLELKGDDLVILKNNLDRCAGKATDECSVVNGVRSQYDRFNGQVKTFVDNVNKVVAMCKGAKNIQNVDDLFSTLSDLNDQGDELRGLAADLKADQAENSGGKAYCRFVKEKMQFAKATVSQNLRVVLDLTQRCQASANCKSMKVIQDKGADLRNRAQGLLNNDIATVESACANKDLGTYGPQQIKDFITGPADRVKSQGEALDAEANAFKAEIEAAVRGVQAGIWIEAEQEVASFIKPIGTRPATNTKEINPPWRPPYYGTGDWYLAAGGEWLKYSFTVPKAAKYSFWIRDYVDKFQARGIRRVIVEIDGKRYAVTGENDRNPQGDKGTFAWHKVGSGIQLTAGAHTLTITKEKTTAGAAILDAYYFTSGSETPAEK
ncbi:MAG: hypothetical protein PHT12_03260 [Patescibacteria group bacterium]|nr:hypothetical protein [Patescibacteria group bacterium]